MSFISGYSYKYFGWCGRCLHHPKSLPINVYRAALSRWLICPIAIERYVSRHAWVAYGLTRLYRNYCNGTASYWLEAGRLRIILKLMKITRLNLFNRFLNRTQRNEKPFLWLHRDTEAIL